MILELAFPVIGKTLPTGHEYELYAAVSRTLGEHLPDGIAVASIGGPSLGDHRMMIRRETRLRIRTSAEQLGVLISLAGRFLDVGGSEISLGIPEVRALTPAPELMARVVTIKGFVEPDAFLEAVNRQLLAMEVSGRSEIPLIPVGERAGLPMRRVVRIKGRKIVGFTVVVSALSDQDSLKLQERGVGGRRHMGCGIFAPFRRERMVNHGG